MTFPRSVGLALKPLDLPAEEKQANSLASASSVRSGGDNAAKTDLSGAVHALRPGRTSARSGPCNRLRNGSSAWTRERTGVHAAAGLPLGAFPVRRLTPVAALGMWLAVADHI